MNNRLKLGIFTVIGLFAIIISIFATGTFSLGKTYNIYVKFDDTAGLLKKSKIKIAGVDVGVLKEKSLEGSKAKLHLAINNGVQLHANASADIVSIGVIGTKYIEIIPGDSSYPLLKDGDYISVNAGSSLESALKSIMNKINMSFDNEKDGNMMKNLADSICSLKDLLGNLASCNGEIAGIAKNLNKFCEDVVSMSAKQGLNDIVLSIKDITSKLDILITQVCSGNGSVATLINDQQLGKDLKETVTSAKTTVNTLSSTIDKFSKLKVSLNTAGSYNLKDKKLRSNFGVTIMPSQHRFCYLGFSHNEDGDNEKNNANLEFLLGSRFENFEVCYGAIRGKLGIGGGYSFFQPIYAPYKALEVHFNIYDLARKTHIPKIDAGVKFGLTKWLYTGISVEDIIYKPAVMPYLKIELKL
jgi:phospholipid/cholesterol/gamma-HCH transport system substrate-binding protein